MSEEKILKVLEEIRDIQRENQKSVQESMELSREAIKRQRRVIPLIIVFLAISLLLLFAG
jgi:hypothetical protein